MHILEAQRALCDDERGRVGRLRDLIGLMQDFEHHADVDGRLFHLAIHHAHEIERLIELDQHGVEHDEITDRIAPVANARNAQGHDRDHAEGEDHRLAEIQHRE